MSEDQANVQSDSALTLRDRIAAAIDQRLNDEAVGHTWEVCLMAADAVIAELKQQWRADYGYDG